MTAPAPIVFEIAVRTRNYSNGPRGTTRGAAMAQAAERARQHELGRDKTREALRAAGVSAADLIPCTVVMVRRSSGRIDSDGVVSALKKIRDGIAEGLGVDDGSPVVRWGYNKESAPQGVHGVRVTIARRLPR